MLLFCYVFTFFVRCLFFGLIFSINILFELYNAINTDSFACLFVNEDSTSAIN